jgi:hypothetical protein
VVFHSFWDQKIYRYTRFWGTVPDFFFSKKEFSDPVYAYKLQKLNFASFLGKDTHATSDSQSSVNPQENSTKTPAKTPAEKATNPGTFF